MCTSQHTNPATTHHHVTKHAAIKDNATISSSLLWNSLYRPAQISEIATLTLTATGCWRPTLSTAASYPCKSPHCIASERGLPRNSQGYVVTRQRSKCCKRSPNVGANSPGSLSH